MTRQTANSNDVVEKIKENYQSIVLGLIVFLIAATAIYRAIGNKSQTGLSAKDDDTRNEQEASTQPAKVGEVYTVRKGDTLWKIAQDSFGSGYNFVDIAKANKLTNANRIEVGTKLMIPSVTPRKLTKGMVTNSATGKVTITEDQYTVKKGDHLWKIAVGAYGDGYAWVKIAKENTLRNPNLIVPGQVIRLTR